MDYTPKDIIDIVKAVLITAVVAILLWCVLHECARYTVVETVVVDCTKVSGAEYYEVVVEDAEGNQWAYYSDHYTEAGLVSCKFNDNGEIIDVK